jgi:DNA-binding response OmpR family regulator
VKVLLVDDDLDLLDVTAYALRREGFNVITATDGVQSLERWRADQPDLVVLDVGLPRLSGLAVLKQIRQGGATPVILLTALNDEEQIIQGFESGADDYVTKPFSPRQLAMRVRAVGRRATSRDQPEPAREVQVGELVVDIEAHQVRQGDSLIQLTPLEFRLLHLLVSNAGRVVSATRLVDYAWGHDGGETALLRTHMSHLRKKLRLPRRGPGSIGVVSGVGYRLIPPGSGEDGAANGSNGSAT